jgi:hypothetical protein
MMLKKIIFQIKKPNKHIDDGRGDSPRLRPIDSPPRPSCWTLEAQKHHDTYVRRLTIRKRKRNS